eukprot:TRINITY_DN1735_c1_g3_i1.p1 TRINITY_DN1735_c1_g3~~TRINITY_DN1735_c1_g3_i1.p1  ORF type:complete len:130 (-),score=16.12 TRINITY_DN1735_c1_g3_i1:88-477(-)
MARGGDEREKEMVQSENIWELKVPKQRMRLLNIAVGSVDKKQKQKKNKNKRDEGGGLGLTTTPTHRNIRQGRGSSVSDSAKGAKKLLHVHNAFCFNSESEVEWGGWESNSLQYLISALSQGDYTNTRHV